MNNPTETAHTAARLHILLLILTLFPLGASASGLNHRLSVTVSPDDGKLVVEDTIEVAQPTTRFEFVLNAGLSVRAESGRLEAIATTDDGLRTAYRVTQQTADTALKLHYHGRPRFSGQRSLGGMPRGIVDSEGVYLDGSSAWYPMFDQPIASLQLKVRLPTGWRAVSIGRLTEADGAMFWSSRKPHDDIYLIAGRFSRHARQHRGIDLSVWLLDDDPTLAALYLGLIGDYIDHYSTLIGDYPFAKFAVVENRWQTGFGMPSFTLLGSRVMRLPFIPYTSLPHEILHNWWGNGVWIDHARGNWSEGLTAYLADHWMQERRGKGGQYRLKALQRYTNFAADGRDRPLLEFVSRHNDASQSIGYSKSLMLFHMLRRELGDDRFIDGLRALWQTYRFQPIGFAQAVDAIIGADPERTARYRQWLVRPGAPRLRIGTPRVTMQAGGHRLTLPISQIQDTPFTFDLPVAVTLQGENTARQLSVRIDAAHNQAMFDLPAAPSRVDIDPQYDVLRYLDASEQPPALNRLFGGAAWLILPTAADSLRGAWLELADVWKKRYPSLRTIDDTDAATLAPSADRIVLGWGNRQLNDAVARVRRSDQSLHTNGAEIGGTGYPAHDHSIVLVNNDARGVTSAFIGAPSGTAVSALARKLPHYGSYGRLVFDAASGENQLKEGLGSDHSTLSHRFDDRQVPLNLPARTALDPG